MILLCIQYCWRRYYGHLYAHSLPASLHRVVAKLRLCDDILFNFLVSHVTKLPPIKLAQRWTVRDHGPSFVGGATNATANDARAAADAGESERFARLSYCLNRFADWFGYMPLRRSAVRLDPLLFKDNVSMFRKKYRMVESAT